MDNRLKDMLSDQRKMLATLEGQLKVLESRDIFRENDMLREKLAQLDAKYDALRAKEEALAADNANLKNTLYEQFYNEKLDILKRSQRKQEILFKNEAEGAQSRLAVLENNINSRLYHMKTVLEHNRVDIQNDIYEKIADLQAKSAEKIAEARMELAHNLALRGSEKEEFEKLKAEELTNEQISALAKKNNFERIVGLNVLNTIGIILIIIGVIAAGQFAYVRMPDIGRAAGLFALGIVFLVAGEVMNRKKPNIFSLGITAGGVGILYAALAVSYFGMEVFGQEMAGMYAALAVCVAITAVAFLLSTRYNSQILLAIALVGGYLPIFSIGPERALLFGVMGYFTLLNTLALLVAFKKKWIVATFVGMSLNIIGMIYLSTFIWSIHPLHERIIEITYITVAMLTYTVIPILGTYRTKSRFKASDIVLLAVNGFFGSIIIFVNIGFSGWHDYFGLTSALFALFYLGMGFLVSRKFAGAKAVPALFFISGITFAVLFVPFQLDVVWLTLGWLVQGVGLAIYGILRDKRGFKISGGVIGAICLAWFLLYDASIGAWSGFDGFFTIKYLAITCAGFVIMAAFMHTKTHHGMFQKAFKYAAAVNLWFFVIYLITRLDVVLHNAFPYSQLDIGYLMLSLMGIATIALGLILPKIKPLLDGGMKLISVCLGVLGVAGIFVINVAFSPVAGPMAQQETGIILLATFILLADSVISAYAVFNLTRRAVLERTIGVQYLPLAVSAYIIVISTVNLINHYNLSFASFWISIIYAFTALLWTILGFVKRYALLRQFGLVLSLLAVAKFFVIDLFTLTLGFRILSYFVLGVVLVTISFVYQYFSKRLERSILSQE